MKNIKLLHIQYSSIKLFRLIYFINTLNIYNSDNMIIKSETETQTETETETQTETESKTNNDVLSNPKLHIDICIPFYLYKGCPHRVENTERKFKYLLRLKKDFSERVNFTFTLIGSEKELSKSLFEKYFEDEADTYYEYDQGEVTPGYNVPFLNMLTGKFRFSFNKSFEKKPNISLLNGSNDFVSINFYEQIIDFYDKDEKQLFGIDNFYNGNNFVFYGLFDSFKNEFYDSWIWTGLSTPPRDIYKYCGGIIGFNDFFYNSNYDILNTTIVSFDEGEIERLSTNLKDTVKFNSINCFFLNIKSIGDSADLTPYWLTKNDFCSAFKQELDISVLSEESKERLTSELNIFLTK